MERIPKKLAHLACASILAASMGAAYAGGDNARQGNIDDHARLSQQEIRSYEAARASQLIGTRVSDKNGQALGKIDDMVIHMSTGDVRYAILAHQVADNDERLYAVPLDRLSRKDNGQLSIDMAANELGDDRWWRKDKWPDLLDSAFWGEIDRLSGLPAIQPSEKYYAHRLSDLIGKDVTSPNGKDLGTVRDLVINMNDASVHYAIMGFQGAGAAADRRYAVPITAFMFPREGESHRIQTDRLVLNVEPQALQQMHSFSDNAWPDFSDPSRVAQIDRYLIAIFPAAGSAPAGTGATGTASGSGFASGQSAGGSTGGASPGGQTVSASSNDAVRLFDRVDADGNGMIDREEFSQHQQLAHGVSARR